MYSNTAARASARVRNRASWTRSVLSEAKKLSMGALSRQLPRRLIDCWMPWRASTARYGPEAYWADSSGCRNTLTEGVAMRAGRRRSDRALRAVLPRSPGRPGVAQRENRRRFWAAIAAGRSSEGAAVEAGGSPPVGTRWFREAGGMPPKLLSPSAKPLSGRYLVFAEREQIALCRAQGQGTREIARRLGRAASTISRELRRNAATRGGGLEYRASTAQWHAERAARRPKRAKLATNAASQFTRVLAKVEASAEIVRLGEDDRGRERFTTRAMLATEERMERTAERLPAARWHRVGALALDGAVRERGLGDEQRAAFWHVTGKRDLALVVGYAGTGKSTMLSAAREAWEGSGYTVRGAALSGIAAEALEGGSGINSRTIASLEHGWGQERDQLTKRDVLVIDEAGMVGSRQMERVLSHAAEAGAKVVLVGDPEQLQAIEAGAAFRALSERHGAAEITEVRRQHHAWQREATKE